MGAYSLFTIFLASADGGSRTSHRGKGIELDLDVNHDTDKNTQYANAIPRIISPCGLIMVAPRIWLTPRPQ